MSPASRLKHHQIWNTVKSFAHARKLGFRNWGKSCLWNPWFWALDSGVQLKESGILLTIWIQNPASTAWNPQSKTVLDSPKYGVESEKALLSNTYSYSPYEGRAPPFLIVWFKIMKVRYVNTGKWKDCNAYLLNFLVELDNFVISVLKKESE